MSLQFDLHRLSSLYQFKKDTIQLCIQFIKDVIKNSSHSKMKYTKKLNEIETDLYDIFCRWNFNCIQKNTFDMNTFLPTDDFIILVDISYYLRRFHIELSDSLIEFPFHEFNKIREKAKENSISLHTRPISCSSLQNKRLHSIYKGNDFENDKLKLLSRYYYLGGLNNSLSTPPEVLSLFKSHELFGTPFNTCSEYFCSPFQDEVLFGSSGSFFQFSEYQKDIVYFANPPFDDTFCTKMAERLLEQLSVQLFSLIVIIPVWDKDQQDKYNLKNFGLSFESYQKLIQSPYFIKEEFLPKSCYPFFNYFYQRYVYISNTHIINLGVPVDIKKIMSTWISLKNEKPKESKPI